MSLLMRALEKAAKDRAEVRSEAGATGAPAAEPRPELSLALELLAADTPSPRLKEEPSQQTTPGPRSAGPVYSREPPRAAAAPQASRDAGSAIGAYVRDRPLVIIGAIAGLFAAGFGMYVYLQIFHPGIFRARPATSAPLVQPPSPAPPPAAVAPDTAASAPQPIASAAVLQPDAATPPQQPDPAPREPPQAAAPRQAQKPSAPEPPKQEPAHRERIVVKRGEPVAAVNPQLVEAHAALEGGRLDAASQLYTAVARAEPKNIDALLGLAAIAVQEARTDEAIKQYLAVLELDPRHALAQSGLIGLMGRSDPLAAESRLKQLIAREPSAFLYFTLGNLYADQGLWAQAQQAYFQAHHLDPQNPDYAYNLAVSLDQISQPRLAVGFYRRAVELASTRGRVNFDLSRARERLAALAAQLN